MNYLFKDLVETYVFSDANSDRNVEKDVVINGRSYVKFGTCTATTFVVNLYKIFDHSVNHNKYVAQFGVARQHPCDIKLDKQVGEETANLNAMMNPTMNIVFDNKPSNDIIKTFAEVYLDSMDIKFVKTRQEMIAEGKGNDLKNKKYNR